MSVDFVLLPEHPKTCPVCGGVGEMMLYLLSWRLPAAWMWRTVPCPLRSGSDDLRALVAGGVA